MNNIKESNSCILLLLRRLFIKKGNEIFTMTKIFTSQWFLSHHPYFIRHAAGPFFAKTFSNYLFFNNAINSNSIICRSFNSMIFRIPTGGIKLISNTSLVQKTSCSLQFSSYAKNPPPFLKRPSSFSKPNNNNSEVGVAAKIFSKTDYLNNKKKKMSNHLTSDAIVWVDCEMSGLDVNTETIMEIACIITGPQLEIIDKLESIIIKTDENILNGMDAWCVQHHGDSGLTQSCRESTITMKDAEEKLVKFVSKHVEKGKAPLGGNSIHMDRLFIAKYMPQLNEHLHYRNVDVSTIKELVRRWYPTEYYEAPKKRFEHRTMSDIEDSIAELKYYRTAVFKEPLKKEEKVTS